jgi:hypothetical protein
MAGRKLSYDIVLVGFGRCGSGGQTLMDGGPLLIRGRARYGWQKLRTLNLIRVEDFPLGNRFSFIRTYRNKLVVIRIPGSERRHFPFGTLG